MRESGFRAGSPAAVVARVHAALDEVAPSVDVPAAELARVVHELDRAANRLSALKLSLVAAADAANVAATSGASSTAAWLNVTTRVGGGPAAGQVALATALGEGLLPATKAALDDGGVSAVNAGIVADAMRAMPEGLSADDRFVVEARLVRDARRLDPHTLRRAARRALDAVKAAHDVDAHEEALLSTQEERAWAGAKLTLHDHGDGTTSGHFVVPTLAASILRKAVQQLASPRREEQQTGVPAADRDWSAEDWAHRYGVAFAQLLEHLPTDGLHGKVAATVVVTMSHEALITGVGAARVDTGTDLSAGAVRRLACGAGIVPVVLGGESLPLDLGRTRRFFGEQQRVGLSTMYEECAAENCDRPYAWCELHHEQGWAANNGPTDLKTAVLLCGFHHRRTHDRYASRIDADQRGRKTVTFRLRT